MRYPSYIRPLIDAGNEAFAVQVCKQNDDKAISFSKPKGEQLNGVSISLKAVLNTIRSIMGEKWNETHRYRITGIYYQEAKAMVFDLSSAEETKIIRPSKKK